MSVSVAGENCITMKSPKDKRKSIFRATLRLISANGFHGTPMSQIAKEAGVSTGIIYHYFENKTELLNLLYHNIKKNCARHVLKSMKDELPTEEKLKQIFANIFHYYIEHWDELSFMEQYENSPLINEATHKKASDLLTPVFNIFERAQKENNLKPLRTEILITLSFGAVASLAKLYMSRKIPFDNALIDNEIEAVWDMIKQIG